MTDEHAAAIIAAIEGNLERSVALWGEIPSAEIEDDGVILRIATPVRLAAMNMALARRPIPAGECDARVAETRAFFAARGRSGVWWDLPTRRSDALAASLHAHGFQAQRPTPAMARDLATDDNAPPPLPPAVVITRVTDGVQMAHWADVATRGFAIPADHQAAYRIYVAELLALPGVELYLASRHGDAVAIGMLVPEQTVAGLYWIATVPEARGQGLGAAITQALLAQARRAGCRYAVLESSKDGYRLYRRLGFYDYSRINTYQLPEENTTPG